MPGVRLKLCSQGKINGKAVCVSRTSDTLAVRGTSASMPPHTPDLAPIYGARVRAAWVASYVLSSRLATTGQKSGVLVHG